MSEHCDREVIHADADFPHCDADVLHAPGMCRYCDDFPELHQARLEANVNFTGEDDPSKDPCPATVRRSLDRIERWGGNVAKSPDGLGDQVSV